MSSDVADIEKWANSGAEIGTEISAYQRYHGLGADPETGQYIDYSGSWRARDLDEMLVREGYARACEQALTLPLRGAPLTIRPAKDDRGEAEFVNTVFDDLAEPLENVVGQAAQSLIYRMTFLEKVWAVRNNRIVLSGLPWRPPDSCAPLRDPATGQLNGFKQNLAAFANLNVNSKGWVTIPAAKAVVFLHGAARDPIRGVSEMQTAYRIYVDKQKVRFLWATFLEGAAVARVIATAPSGQVAETTKQLAQLKNAGVATVPDGTTVTALNIVGEGSQAFREAMAYLDSELLASVLAGFLGLAGAATSGRGSYALSKDQSDFFTQSLDAAAREIAASLRSQIVRPLVVVNFGPDAAVPDVKLGPVSGATSQEQMAFLQALAGAPSGTLLPREFVDELAVHVAGFLDLDTDKVTAAIKQAEQQAAAAPPPGTSPQTAGLRGAIGQAAKMVTAGPQDEAAALAPLLNG